MKGKNQRSVSTKANAEALARIAELEAEVERLRSIENVAELHVKALGEIERLTARVLQLDGVERERERLRLMVEHANEEAAAYKKQMVDSATVHAQMVEIALDAAPAGLDGTQRVDWLIARLGHRGRYVNSPHLVKLMNQGASVPDALIARTP